LSLIVIKELDFDKGREEEKKEKEENKFSDSIILGRQE
jgi:hypothetical protein